MRNIYLTFLLFSSACLFIGCGEDDPVYGCMDESASNYNADATEDDPNNPCTYASSAGCMDSVACNYNENATEDDGSCEFPSENALELVSTNFEVTGNVGEELVYHLEIRNGSCMDMTISASQELISGGGQGWGETKFCLGTPEGGLCYAYGVNESDPADAFPVASFEEGDYFQGYLKADNAGEYVMKYTITSCCAAELEVEVTFNVVE